MHSTDGAVNYAHWILQGSSLRTRSCLRTSASNTDAAMQLVGTWMVQADPCCRVQFSHRARVITHLSETRYRAKVQYVTCRDRVLAGEFPQADKLALHSMVATTRTSSDTERRTERATPTFLLTAPQSEAAGPTEQCVDTREATNHLHDIVRTMMDSSVQRIV